MDKNAQISFFNLMNQIKKIKNHNRQGSFKTKERYYEANQRFVKFLSEHFGTKQFANIQDKHIKAYVEDMKKRDLSASTIKTDLGAIRFYHSKLDNARYEISDNKEFGLARRKFGNVDRAWSEVEFSKFKEVCKSYGNERVEAISILARNEGLRIHETLRISRSDVEYALSSGFLHVKGKGGKERDVLLTRESKEMLQTKIQEVERGHKVFVEDGEKTHLVIKQVQNFIVRHRDEWQEASREVNRTFHGLRHAYAREQYEQTLSKGLSELEARKEVSEKLGHERDDVTRVYLAKK